MDIKICIIFGIYFPAVLFVLSLSVTGLNGVEDIMTALDKFSPFGMVGDVFSLVLLVITGYALAEYLLELYFWYLLIVMHILFGKTKEEMKEWVNSGPWSGMLKAKTLLHLEKLKI